MSLFTPRSDALDERERKLQRERHAFEQERNAFRRERDAQQEIRTLREEKLLNELTWTFVIPETEPTNVTILAGTDAFQSNGVGALGRCSNAFRSWSATASPSSFSPT